MESPHRPDTSHTDRAKAQTEQPTPELKPLLANLGKSKGENSKFSKAHRPHSIEHGPFTRMRLKAYTGVQPSCDRNDLTRPAQHYTRSVHSSTDELNIRARSVYDKTPPSPHEHRPPFNACPHGHRISFSTRASLLNTRSLSLHPDRASSRVTETLAVPSLSSHPLFSLANMSGLRLELGTRRANFDMVNIAVGGDEKEGHSSEEWGSPEIKIEALSMGPSGGMLTLRSEELQSCAMGPSESGMESEKSKQTGEELCRLVKEFVTPV